LQLPLFFAEKVFFHHFIWLFGFFLLVLHTDFFAKTFGYRQTCSATATVEAARAEAERCKVEKPSAAKRKGGEGISTYIFKAFT